MALKIKLLAFTVIAVAIIAAYILPLKMTQMKIDNSPESAEGFVVMELFTSQGCSSCPPADKLLGQYANKNDERIISLAFHVDYWNRLGWTDSFSSAKYSSRQREYSMTIDNSSVYTPQLVLNGTKELVGSEEYKIEAYVDAAVKEKPSILISIDKAESTVGNILINYTLSQIPANTTLNAALVQKQAFTNILKGENRGLKLLNYNVVRNFLSGPIKTKSSSLNLELPAGYNEKDFSVVLFSQDDASGRITGATRKSF